MERNWRTSNVLFTFSTLDLSSSLYRHKNHILIIIIIFFFFWLNIVFYFCKWSLIMNTGAHSEGVRGFDWSTPFDSKFNFHRTFWIHSINLGHLSLYHFNKSILLPLSVYKIAGWVATLIYTVCSGLSVRKHRVSTVICLNQHPPPQKSSWVRPWHNCYLDKWRPAELQW